MNAPKDGFRVLARLGVGFLLAYAGWSKLMEPSANFEAALLKYGVFSPEWIFWIARILPWAEWITGCFLMAGYAARGAAFAAAFLLLAFLVSLGSSPLLLESGGADCGCFGRAGFLHLTVRQVFLADLVNFALALWLAFSSRFPWSLDAFLLKPLPGGDDNKKQAKRNT